MAQRKRRHEHEEAHSSHERWLITYADMITLLMVLFIVLFAVSQVDQKRFDELREGMAAGFGQQPSPMTGDRSILTESGTMPMPPVSPDVTLDLAGADTQDDLAGQQGAKSQDAQQAEESQQEAERQQAVSDEQERYAEARAEVLKLEALRKRVQKALRRQGLLHDVSMNIDERGLRISLVSRHIVFRANVADLSSRGVRVLDVLAPVLRDLPNQIEVAGHTNQVKVKPKYYPTDWELSAARAVTVLRHLDEQGGIPTSHMVAVAHGHTQPLIDPKKPGSQALNKRVDIIVKSEARDDVRGLFADVLRDIKNA